MLFISVEYIIIYQLNYDSKTAGAYKGSDVIIAPFEIWKHYSSNIYFSFISSLLFPLIYVLFTKAMVLKNKMVLFASINFLIGLLIYIFFAEGGYRKLHGNFGWQIVTANYLLFFSFMLYLINDIKTSVKVNPKQVILCILFLLHFGWGLIYLLKIIVVKSHSWKVILHLVTLFTTTFLVWTDSSENKYLLSLGSPNQLLTNILIRKKNNFPSYLGSQVASYTYSFQRLLKSPILTTTYDINSTNI